MSSKTKQWATPWQKALTIPSINRVWKSREMGQAWRPFDGSSLCSSHGQTWAGGPQAAVLASPPPLCSPSNPHALCFSPSTQFFSLQCSEEAAKGHRRRGSAARTWQVSGVTGEFQPRFRCPGVPTLPVWAGRQQNPPSHPASSRNPGLRPRPQLWQALGTQCQYVLRLWWRQRSSRYDPTGPCQPQGGRREGGSSWSSPSQVPPAFSPTDIRLLCALVGRQQHLPAQELGRVQEAARE